MDTAQQGGQLVPVCLGLPQVEQLVFQEPQTSTPGKARALGLIRSAGYQFLTAVADPGGAEPGSAQGCGREPWTGSLATHRLSFLALPLVNDLRSDLWPQAPRL